MLFFMGFLGEKKILQMATVLINAFQFTIILNLGYCISMCLDGGSKWIGTGSTHLDPCLVKVLCVLDPSLRQIYPCLFGDIR